MTDLAEFGDVYESGEVLQIGTFIIEFAQAIVLGIKTLAKGFKYFDITCPCTRRVNE